MMSPDAYIAIDAERKRLHDARKEALQKIDDPNDFDRAKFDRDYFTDPTRRNNFIKSLMMVGYSYGAAAEIWDKNLPPKPKPSLWRRVIGLLFKPRADAKIWGNKYDAHTHAIASAAGRRMQSGYVPSGNLDNV